MVSEFARFGFTLEAIGDDELLLMHEGEFVCSFYQTRTTKESLQAECARHLALHHHWDGCLWTRKEVPDRET